MAVFVSKGNVGICLLKNTNLSSIKAASSSLRIIKAALNSQLLTMFFLLFILILKTFHHTLGETVIVKFYVKCLQLYLSI